MTSGKAAAGDLLWIAPPKMAPVDSSEEQSRMYSASSCAIGVIRKRKNCPPTVIAFARGCHVRIARNSARRVGIIIVGVIGCRGVLWVSREEEDRSVEEKEKGAHT